MNKFRPQDISKRYIMRHRRKTGRSDNYNWQTRVKWYPAGWKFNHCVISNQFSKLHYLACHAPKSVQKKWRRAYWIFYVKHFGTSRATARYLNRWSCHAWL